MKTSPYVLARRKAARGLLRDAQLPGLTDQSRAVLAFNAVCLCTVATLDGMEERMRDAEWTDTAWQEVQAALIESAKRMLKSKSI